MLVAILALCVSSFGAAGDANDPNLTVLVYQIKNSVSAVIFTDANYTDGQLVKGKVDGYIVFRAYKATLDTYTDSDPNNDPVFIGIDKPNKEYMVASDGGDNTVEIALAESGEPIWDVQKKGKDTGKQDVWAWMYIDIDDANSGATVLQIDVWNGIAQIKETIIDNAKNKVSIPKSIKWGSAELFSDEDDTYSYKIASSISFNSKYTKSANGSSLRPKGAAALIVADLIDKGWTLVSGNDFVQR